MQGVLDTVLSQPGCQRAYYGMEIENPNTLCCLIDWDDISKHVEFMKSEWVFLQDDRQEETETNRKSSAYGPFKKQFGTIMAGDLSMLHANMTPHNPVATLANGKTTELLSADFPADLSDADKKACEATINEVVPTMMSAAGGPSGYAAGFTIEKDLPGEQDPSAKGMKLFSAIGWNSKDEHMAFRETATFKDNIGKLRGMPGLKGLGVFHLAAQVQQAL